jgi:hypothetical protein
MFEVNNDLKVKIEKVSDCQWTTGDGNGIVKFDKSIIKQKMVFVIDDFYKNPDEVREFTISSKKYTDKEKLAGAIGRRVWQENLEVMNEMKYCLSGVFSQLCQHPDWHIKYDEEHNKNKWDCMRFVVNITNNNEIIKSGRTTDSACHVDGPYNKWASIIYLNTAEECEGGTDFYSVVPPDDDGTINLPKKQYRCEMKYNRCVLYDANQVHGAVLEPGMFKTYDRLAQVMFM